MKVLWSIRKTTNKLTETGGKMITASTLKKKTIYTPKSWALSELYGITTKMTILFTFFLCYTPSLILGCGPVSKCCRAAL
jgi:hypothetical protein